MKIRKLAVLAVLVSVAMILSYLESLIPVFIPIPGLKIGLANVATVFCLVLFGFKSAAGVSFIRVCLSALLFGNAVAFIYSIFGAIFSLAVMSALKTTKLFSAVGVSVGGAVSHNIGQIIAAGLVMGTASVAVYLPPLIIGGAVAGVVIGIAAGILSSRLEKIVKM